LQLLCLSLVVVRCQPLRRALYDFLVRMKFRMKFIELEVKTAFIVHGFDENNKEIIENIADEVFVKKLISIDRIQSISEEYVLVTSSHARVMYWEYNCSMEELTKRLKSAGLLIV
ncbi:hypothetical protein, partial [Vibrio cholerae]